MAHMLAGWQVHKHSTVGRIQNTNGLKCQTMMHELYSADPYWNGMMNVFFENVNKVSLFCKMDWRQDIKGDKSRQALDAAQ